MPSKTNKREAEKLGWLVLDKGWPDYLFWKEDKVIFVEVKSNTDTIKKHQKQIHKILKKLGLKVEVIQVSKPMIYTEKGKSRLIKILKDL